MRTITSSTSNLGTDMQKDKIKKPSTSLRSMFAQSSGSTYLNANTECHRLTMTALQSVTSRGRCPFTHISQSVTLTDVVISSRSHSSHTSSIQPSLPLIIAALLSTAGAHRGPLRQIALHNSVQGLHNELRPPSCKKAKAFKSGLTAQRMFGKKKKHSQIVSRPKK